MPEHHYGRLLEHDPASRQYAARAAPAPGTKVWAYRGPLLNQNGIGGCVGWSVGGLFNTAAFWQLRRRHHGGKFYTDADCLAFYSGATVDDGFEGTYPPDDTGSSALGAAKYLKRRGLITRYEHAFGLAHTRRALQLAPAMLGINWREAMDYPDAHGVVEVAGDPVAGHEVLILGTLEGPRLLECLNWWPGYGRERRGFTYGTDQRFYIPFAGAEALLDDAGDVLVIPLGAIT